MSTDKFKIKAALIHGSKYDYSNVAYLNAKTKVEIICLQHGPFHQTPDNHISKRAGCPTCAIKYRSLLFRKTAEQFILDAQKVHGNQYDYCLVEYQNAYTRIKIICPQHGMFLQTPKNHLIDKCGCPACGGTLPLDTNQFIENAQIVHGDKYDYTSVNYINATTPVEIICKKHGSFIQLPSNHTSSQYECPKCTQRISKVESKWLDSHNVPNDFIHRQVSLKFINKRYKVDGYVSETNTVYEFWGDYWHGNPIKYQSNQLHPVAKKTYGELYERTQAKRKLILNAGYNLVEIWESDWKSSTQTKL